MSSPAGLCPRCRTYNVIPDLNLRFEAVLLSAWQLVDTLLRHKILSSFLHNFSTNLSLNRGGSDPCVPIVAKQLLSNYVDSNSSFCVVIPQAVKIVIVPRTWNSGPGLRLEIFGCKVNVTIPRATEVTHNIQVNDSSNLKNFCRFI